MEILLGSKGVWIRFGKQTPKTPGSSKTLQPVQDETLQDLCVLKVQGTSPGSLGVS